MKINRSRFTSGGNVSLGGPAPCQASVWTGFLAGLLLATTTAIGDAGLQDLADRIGEENLPTGDDVTVAQVEAPVSGGHYAPNQNHPEFVGKTFNLMSGDSGTSSHATTVGRNFYGLKTSIAPAIPTIYNYEVNHWIGAGFLRLGAGPSTQPLPTPEGVKLFNHSWIGDMGASTNEIVRRADFVTLRDDVLMIVGVNNDPAQLPLLSSLYNGISVGRLSGNHASAPVGAPSDGPGRMKPELVAPGSLTSWSTAVASAAAALMVEVARSKSGLSSNPMAERTEVLKAVLLAGAARDDTWTNNPVVSGPERGVTVTPIDETFGAGTVNVNRSHLILTGGQHAGGSTPATAPVISSPGWDLHTFGPAETRYWQFEIHESADEAAFLATWHRLVSNVNLNNWVASNIDLRLWLLDEDDQLVSLVGDGGLGIFSEGNVVSQSAVDNVELLHLRDVQPGRYALEVQRQDSSGGPRPVAVAWLIPQAPEIPGDLNGDGVVDVFDLLILLSAWGECRAAMPCPADLNGDGVVDVFDLLILLSNWG